MHPSIPPAIQPLLDAYLAALAPLDAGIAGLYVHGSLALGAFEEHASDIDILVLTHGSWTGQELARLAQCHARLCQTDLLAQRLEAHYVPLGVITNEDTTGARYPCARDGQFLPAGCGAPNAVTVWLLKHGGICLCGPTIDTLPFEVSWQAVREEMRYNLDGYWAGKAARPQLFLADCWVEFAVTTLCRILTTVEDGEIISKTAALACWRERLPVRWQPLLDEAWRLRHQPHTSPRYRTRLGRMLATRAFINYTRRRGRAALATPLPQQIR